MRTYKIQKQNNSFSIQSKIPFFSKDITWDYFRWETYSMEKNSLHNSLSLWERKHPITTFLTFRLFSIVLIFARKSLQLLLNVFFRFAENLGCHVNEWFEFLLNPKSVIQETLKIYWTFYPFYWSFWSILLCKINNFTEHILLEN